MGFASSEWVWVVVLEFYVTCNNISVTYVCDGTDVQADWRIICNYGRAPNAIEIS